MEELNIPQWDSKQEMHLKSRGKKPWAHRESTFNAGLKTFAQSCRQVLAHRVLHLLPQAGWCGLTQGLLNMTDVVITLLTFNHSSHTFAEGVRGHVQCYPHLTRFKSSFSSSFPPGCGSNDTALPVILPACPVLACRKKFWPQRGKKPNQPKHETESWLVLMTSWEYFASGFPDVDVSPWAYSGIAPTLLAVLCTCTGVPNPENWGSFLTLHDTHSSTTSIIQLFHQSHQNIHSHPAHFWLSFRIPLSLLYSNPFFQALTHLKLPVWSWNLSRALSPPQEELPHLCLRSKQVIRRVQ